MWQTYARLRHGAGSGSLQIVLIIGLTDADGLALTMLVTILLSFGVIVMLLVCMFRNASKRDADVDLLLEEVEAEEKSLKTAKTARSTPEPKPWEREGNWWKDTDGGDPP